MQHGVQSLLEFHSRHFLGLGLTVAAGAVYGWLWSLGRHAFRDAIPLWRVRAFYCGLSFLWLAVASPLAELHHELLTIHMVQHLLLSTVAAPLLLLGEPFLLLRRGWRREFAPLPPAPCVPQERLGGAAGWMTHPVFCWLAAVITLLAWHVPRIFEWAMQSPLRHGLQQFTFLATGILFWWPVVRPWPGAPVWPRWSIPLYLLLATLPCDALSAFLTFCGRVVYPVYLDGPGHVPLSPLQDQECAGALMWVWVTVAYLVPAVFITLQILAPPVSRSGEERPVN